jgi:hypothetical protein
MTRDSDSEAPKGLRIEYIAEVGMKKIRLPAR